MSRFIETGDEQRAKARADIEQEYSAWLAEVDKHVRQGAEGVGTADLAGHPYRDLFADGMDSVEAAEYVLGEEGFNL